VAAANPRIGADAVRVIFLGPPGAGKGTQAARLASHLGVPKIGTGEMLRTAIARNTPLGRKPTPSWSRGTSSRTTCSWRSCGSGSASRTATAASSSTGSPHAAAGAGARGDVREPRAWVVFDFEVPRPVLMLRLSGRRWCPACQATFHLLNDPPKREGVCDACGTGLVQREDDHESVVARRLQEYEARTFPSSSTTAPGRA